jgi:hypothetical protein
MVRVCNDCVAIAGELREAYAEAWKSDRGRLRIASMAAYRMIGGDEEDVERAEKLVRQLRAADIPGLQLSRAGRAVLAAITHRAMTGHNVQFDAGA